MPRRRSPPRHEQAGSKPPRAPRPTPSRARRDDAEYGPRERRALNPPRGDVSIAGDAKLAALLARAWRSVGGDGRELTHGFHAYPARLHAHVARTLIAGLAAPRARVLDPFCGSGTVVLEAHAAGRRAVGTDVNPIGLLVASVRTGARDAAFRKALVDTAAKLSKRRATREDHSNETRGLLEELYPAYLLHELFTLREGVRAVREPRLRLALSMVLSSILVKVSRRQSETNFHVDAKPADPGFAPRHFADRARELAEGLAQLETATGSLGHSPSPVLLSQADARALPLRAASIDLVIGSPPYLGTYDYARIQHLRALFLGIELAGAERHEIGARAVARAPRVREGWIGDVRRVLRELGRVLVPGGTAVLALGDSFAGTRAIDAVEIMEEADGEGGMRGVALASAERGVAFEPGRVRTGREVLREHLFALQKG